MSRSLPTLAGVALLAVSACARADTWQIDPMHTAAQFSVRHMGISTVRGAFTKVSGSVQYDAADPSKSTIDVTIDASSVDTRVTMRDNDLRSPAFFDVAKYPTLTFKSRRVEPAGSGTLRVVGDLTIHGVTKEVMLEVEGPSEPMSAHGSLHMGATATTKISRKDFGVNGAAMMVGDEISITIDVELVKPVAAPSH
ncbi:MAG: YceI family protein [Bryobacteraceae bacterium]|jgi:polyisoprenoid-binding protein YceI